VGGRKRVTLFGALNRFRNVMRLLISSDNCMLGFSDAETIDSLFDDAVVDLLSGSGEGGRIKMTSSSSLSSFRGFVGLTRGREMN